MYGFSAYSETPYSTLPSGNTGNASVVLTGAAAAGSAGDPAVTGHAVVALSGVAATGQPGTTSATVSVAAIISGVAASGSHGPVAATGAALVSLVGEAAASSAGNASASATGASTASLTGVAANSSAGTTTATGAALVALSGVQATGSAGSVAFAGQASITPAGASATCAAGVAVTTGDAALEIIGVGAVSGVGAPVAAGQSDGSTVVALTGVQLTAYVGGLVAAGDGAVAEPVYCYGEPPWIRKAREDVECRASTGDAAPDTVPESTGQLPNLERLVEQARWERRAALETVRRDSDAALAEASKAVVATLIKRAEDARSEAEALQRVLDDTRRASDRLHKDRAGSQFISAKEQQIRNDTLALLLLAA